MSASPVSAHSQTIIPQITLGAVAKRPDGQSVGEYVSQTELLYLVKSDTGFEFHKTQIKDAKDFKGNDARMFKIPNATESNSASTIGPDLRDLFTDVFNVSEETIKKMSLSDFGKTRFLTYVDGAMRDLTMDELQNVLEGSENAFQIDATTFPVNGIFYGAVADGGDTKALLKFMRKESYTGKEFEIYTAQGKVRDGNETFKPILQRFLEKFSTFFFTASAALSTALVAQIVTASVAAGVLTFACPPVLIALLGIAIGFIIVGAILLFAAARVENTVQLPQPPKQQQQPA
jgi:hypothetical protein